MTGFLKLLRLKNLLVLALALISTPVFACFSLPQQPPQPVFSKQGSTTLATYTVTGNVGNIIGTAQCSVTDVSTINIPVVTAFGYTYKSADFFVTNGNPCRVIAPQVLWINARFSPGQQSLPYVAYLSTWFIHWQALTMEIIHQVTSFTDQKSFFHLAPLEAH